MPPERSNPVNKPNEATQPNRVCYLLHCFVGITVFSVSGAPKQNNKPLSGACSTLTTILLMLVAPSLLSSTQESEQPKSSFSLFCCYDFFKSPCLCYQPLDLLLLKGRHRIFNMCSHVSACWAHEGKPGTSCICMSVDTEVKNSPANHCIQETFHGHWIYT